MSVMANQGRRTSQTPQTLQASICSTPHSVTKHTLKVLVIGEVGTGKTSIIKRYVEQYFSESYKATIGVDFGSKWLNWDRSTAIKVDLWDIAGQERLGCMTRAYYKDAVGCLVVFDVTSLHTFDAVLQWKNDLDECVHLNGGNIPCVLLANKCDLAPEGFFMTPEQMNRYCADNQFSAWYATSAKASINVDEAVRTLVVKVLEAVRGEPVSQLERSAVSLKDKNCGGFKRRVHCDC